MRRKICLVSILLFSFIIICTYTKTHEIYNSSLTHNINKKQTDIVISIELPNNEIIKNTKVMDIEQVFDLTDTSIVLEPIYVEIKKNKYENKVYEVNNYIDDILAKRHIEVQNREKLNELISEYSNQAININNIALKDRESELIRINNMRKMLIEARDISSKRLSLKQLGEK